MTDKNSPIATAEQDAAWTADFKASWAGSPYPPVFVTADAVVIRDGKILLIRRGGMPGRGRLALPGGYIEQDEYWRDAAIRELIEEAAPSLDGRPMSPEELAQRITRAQVVDDPHRSARGRVITMVFKFDLSEPSIAFTAGDDAASVAFHDIATLEPSDFLEDHFHIIEVMTSDKPTP